MRTTRRVDIRELDEPATETSPDVQRWALERFDRALLVLGDLTPSLRPFSHCWAAYDHDGRQIRGLAVRFGGFKSPTASLVSDDPEATDALLEVVAGGEPISLAASATQALPAALEASAQSLDPWMIAPCSKENGNPPQVEPLTDERELSAFYGERGVSFWSPAMLDFGHAFGIRGPDGALISAGGVNFVLSSASYAQVGALVTHPGHRGRGHGSHVLAAIRRSLGIAGISMCGLFADAADARLPGLYARHGFTRRGAYRFVTAGSP